MRRHLWTAACLAGLGVAMAGRPAPAQLTPAPPPAPAAKGPAANALMTNPATNPYLNPAIGMNQDPAMARDAALLYLLNRQAQGGIGSGGLAAVRQGPRAATTNRAPTRFAPAAMVPGSGASRYFNSGQGAANQMNDYYNRRSRVMNSGRR